MANRTVQIRGQGYGNSTISAAVTFDGTAVFNSVIPTVNTGNISHQPGDQVDMISFEIPVTQAGTFPVTITFTGGDAVFVEQVLANYNSIYNPVYNQAQQDTLLDPNTTLQQKIPIWSSVAQPPFSAEDLAIIENGTVAERKAVLAAHNATLFVSSGPNSYGDISQGESKINVVINGVPEIIPNPKPEYAQGEWGFVVPVVSGTATMNFDLIVTAGLA